MEFSLKSMAAVLLVGGVVLGFSTLYLENQEIKEYNQELLMELQEKRESSREANAQVEELNSSLISLRENLNNVKQRNADLRRENRQALTYMTYESREGSTGQVEVAFSVYNFGNNTATDLTGECRVAREGVDQGYNQFTVNLGDVEGRTAETKSREVQFMESIRGSDRISCSITGCSGNCQPLQQRLDSYVVNNPGTSFN